MTSGRLRLHILCEDRLHRRFIERLADRWKIGPRQRTIQAAPAARGSAAGFVLEHFVEAVRLWRAERHDLNVKLLVVIDGDEVGYQRRMQRLSQLLADGGLAALSPTDPGAAILVPTWHIETWIAWLCGHRPIDETTRYKPGDPAGAAVGRLIESDVHSVRRAVDAWLPAASDETSHVPALTRGRAELRRLGLSA